MVRETAGWRSNGLRCAIVGVMACALCAGMLRAEEDDDDPTQSFVTVVNLENADQPLDTVAPPSQFNVPDGDELWKRAWQRALQPSADGGGYFDLSAMLGDFVSAKNFHYEFYAEGDSGDELQVVIAADEATKEDKSILLKRMRIIYFITNSSVSMPKKPAGKNETARALKREKNEKLEKEKGEKIGKPEKPEKADKPEKPEKAPKSDDKKKPKEKTAPSSGLADSFVGGRMVITAPNAVIDLATNEGLATGNVTIEIFGKPDPAKKDEPEQPTAVLSSERLHWRTWSEPAIGSNELALYTCALKENEPDPLVTAKYLIPQADGTVSTMLIQGRGMVYETGTLDRLNTVYDEDGRTAGLSTIARNRAIFRNNISVNVTGTTMFAPPMPFSGPLTTEATGEAVSTGKKKQPKPTLPVAPSRTLITCGGPALIDLAAIPKVKRTASEDLSKAPAPAENAAAGMKQIPLARRLEFLNDVVIDREPLAGAPIPPGAEELTKKHMSCRHLSIVYPPGSMPSTATFPEYAEAIGGVKMSGMMAAPTNADTPNAVAAPASPFELTCNRMFFDGMKDNMFLVGIPGQPVQVNSSQADVQSQQFNFRSKTQTLTMPSSGRKRMVIHAGALAAPAKPADPAAAGKAEVFNPLAGGGDTIIEWSGPLSRELRHLPVPGQADRISELLTIKDDVRIERPQSGLKMAGKVIRLIRVMPSGDVEFLQGEGGVDVTMGNLQATGDNVGVEMKMDKGEWQKYLITVKGSRKNDIKATLFHSGTAVRADKFIIDRTAGTFRALGGALAVVKAPEKPGAAPVDPTPAAADAGALFKGFSFKPGGNLMMQCDGEFSQDDATHTVTIHKNVMIRQPGLQMLADHVTIELDQATPNEGETGTPAGDFFSGGLKALSCSGNVELTTPDQLVQCDKLVHSVKDNSSLLSVDDPENDVRIYLREENGGTRFLSVQKSLKLDSTTGTFTPGGKLLMLPYRKEKPAPRDKYSSPAVKKKIAPEGATK